MKNCHGIIVHQRLTFLRRMVLLREWYEELKKVLLQHCYNPAWMRNGGMIPWSVTVVCETYKTSHRTGKHLMKRRSGKPFEGPVIPFGSMIKYGPVCAKDQSRLHFALIGIIDTSDDAPSQKEISHVLVRLLLRRDAETFKCHLQHAC